ncbi:MAG: hypothetical protein RMJ67_07820 [Elusimicrobiota bacterium]|nr:hypothetical protein [Endomicrobiia bacterium]MDW8166400.1 hypothetical protein [Elusimicrobiota bacterium]
MRQKFSSKVFVVLFLFFMLLFLNNNLAYASDNEIKIDSKNKEKSYLDRVVERYLPESMFKEGKVIHTQEKILDDVFLHEYRIKTNPDTPDLFLFITQVRDDVFVSGDLFVVKQGQIEAITSDRISSYYRSFEKKIQESIPETFKNIDRSKLIKIGTGNEKNQLIVVLTTTCPHCQKLAQDIVKNQYSKKYDTTFYVLLLGDEKELKYVLCSKDKTKSLFNLMSAIQSKTKDKLKPAIVSCSIDIKSHSDYYRSVASKLNINAVPFIFNDKCNVVGWVEETIKDKCFIKN